MNKTEYRKSLKILKDNYNNEKGLLDKKYADANSPYKIDDIIKDSYQIIKIKEIKWRRGGDLEMNPNAYPECVYYGIKLKKDLTLFKSGEKSSIVQSNIITESKKIKR